MTESLPRNAVPIFKVIYQHPFVHGLAEGHLPRESLLPYVSQSTQYLNVCRTVYTMALAKSHARAHRRLFHDHLRMMKSVAVGSRSTRPFLSLVMTLEQWTGSGVDDCV